MSERINEQFDPDLEDWCNGDRVHDLKSSIESCYELLSWSGLLVPMLRSWVKNQILLEFLSGDSLEEALGDPKIADKTLVSWARNLWTHRLETIYLTNKGQLDRVTCSLLRVKDRDLSFELFNRLKAGESSFEQLSWRYGEGPERLHGGIFDNRRIQELPPSLSLLLSKAKPGEVLKPHRLGEWYVVMLYTQWTPAQFDKSTKSLLLKCELNKWIDAVVVELQAHLK